jgi:anthranilate phosphoribosyltransferase
MASSADAKAQEANPSTITINPLLKALRPTDVQVPAANAAEIASGVSKIFTNQLSPVQAALLLYNLSITGLEQRPDVLAQCASVMRSAAEPVAIDQLQQVVQQRGRRRGGYNGGLVR